MTDYEDIETSTIAYVGVVSVLAVIVIVLILEVTYYSYRNRLAAGFGSPPAAGRLALERANLVAEQQTRLTVPELIDRKEGVVRIPIARAMDLVVAELRSGKKPSQVIGPRRAKRSAAARSAPSKTAPPQGAGDGSGEGQTTKGKGAATREQASSPKKEGQKP